MTERLSLHNIIELKEVVHVRTATYKEEYNDGKGGWHVERGAGPKPLGGRWLHLTPSLPHTGTAKVVGYTHKTS